MINLNNISRRFDKYKSFVIEILVDYYGEKNRGEIVNRLNSVYFNFSSTPVDNYQYALVHRDEMSKSDFMLSKVKYIQYKIKNNKSRKLNNNLLRKYIIDKFSIDNLDELIQDEDVVLSLFSDRTFGSSQIDSFSSKNIQLQKSSQIPNDIRERIKKEQNQFNGIMSKLGIKIKNPPSDLVDQFIAYRKKVQLNYKNYIAIKSKFGKEIFKEMSSQFHLKLNPNIFRDILFRENAFSGSVVVNGEVFYNYVRVPLVHLLNQGLKGLDVNLIHEMIHKVETDGNNVGITSYNQENSDNGKNAVLNDIRTQILAIKFTKQLHDMGIYIYDDPLDCRVEGESDYEWLFPLSLCFLEAYDDIFKECAFHNTPSKLDEYFGPNFYKYSSYINSRYHHFKKHLSKDNCYSSCIQMDNEVNCFIESMESFYNHKMNNKRLTNVIQYK